MGVCVQIMVDAEVSGVMFTRHPTTSDPRNIVITSNYGLGEVIILQIKFLNCLTYQTQLLHYLSISYLCWFSILVGSFCYGRTRHYSSTKRLE